MQQEQRPSSSGRRHLRFGSGRSCSTGIDSGHVGIVGYVGSGFGRIGFGSDGRTGIGRQPIRQAAT